MFVLKLGFCKITIYRIVAIPRSGWLQMLFLDSWLSNENSSLLHFSFFSFYFFNFIEKHQRLHHNTLMSQDFVTSYFTLLRVLPTSLFLSLSLSLSLPAVGVPERNGL